MALWTSDLTLTPEYLARHPGFVALSEGRAVGVCMLEARDGCWALEHLWIDPEHQQRGIGRQLVMNALDTVRRAGGGRVEVLADPHAEPFYLKLGAHRIGSVPAPMPGAADRALPLLEFEVVAGVRS
jgi:predicted N-acetyltransferase YhbS